jgi:hypothetical protein
MSLGAIVRGARHVIGRAATLLFMLWTGVVALVLVDTFLHVYLHVCPLHLARFAPGAIMPVLYGRPMGDAFAKAERGDRVLGGCVVGPVAGVCPFCHWPAAFTLGSPEEVTLDDRALAGLSTTERAAVRRLVDRVYQEAGGDEWVTAVSITPDDVWIGTVNSGLHRLDRTTGATASYRNGVIGDCIHAVRRDGTRVIVVHESGGSNALSREDGTTDRGRTWQSR